MLTIKPTDSDSDSIFLSGWKSTEYEFVWSQGPVNIMNIPIGSASEFRGRNLKFAIEVNVPITPTNPNGSRLTFMLGSSVLLEQTVKERTRLIFHAPAAATTPRLNILHITNHNPASIDGMALGFQLYEIEIDDLPSLKEGEVIQFGHGSPHTNILSHGWKDPEESFCWSTGVESTLTLFFDAELCRYDERECMRLAEIVLSVSFHTYIDPALSHMHIIDVTANQVLVQRQIYPGVQGLVPIRAFLPLRADATCELRLTDHAATTPALLGNDPNDHTVLGFQLFSLEMVRIIDLPCLGRTSMACLFTPVSALALTSCGAPDHG
jgi:hypothetical protein